MTQRATFDVPFSKLGTADLRVPLSANPRYHYDKQRRCVHVSHDPLPQLAHDGMMPVRGPVRGSYRGSGRDQTIDPDYDNGNNGALSSEIVAFLRDRLGEQSFAELCEMCGIEEPAETADEEIEQHTNFGMDSAERRSFNKRYPHFNRLKFAGP